MSAQAPSKGRVRSDRLIAGGLVVLIALALFFFSSQSQQALRSSATGLDGLEIWLQSQDQPARSITGGWPIDKSTVGLAVVPIYDTRLGGGRPRPRTQEELLMQQDEFDISFYTLLDKSRTVPTLLVLPKWRSGLRLTGVGHPVLLSERGRISALARVLILDEQAQIITARQPFLEFDHPETGGTAQIYVPQMLRAPACTPLIGTADAMLLARCPIPERTDDDAPRDVFVLSDPDLLNNHGLRLGDNAQIVHAVLSELAGDKAVFVDYSTSNWFVSFGSQGDQYERSWEDLARFFAPPFTLLWAAGAILLALALWRAGVRFGPVIQTLTGLSASKLQAVIARAKLMRLANQDGAMLSDYAGVRIASLSARIFGPGQAQYYANEENFLRYVQRRHPNHAAPLAEVLNKIRNLPQRVSAAHALAQVDELERVLEQIAHDT